MIYKECNDCIGIAGGNRLHFQNDSILSLKQPGINFGGLNFRQHGTNGVQISIIKKHNHLINNQLCLNSVGVAGLEPATTCTPCKYASQLRHTP